MTERNRAVWRTPTVSESASVSSAITIIWLSPPADVESRQVSISHRVRRWSTTASRRELITIKNVGAIKGSKRGRSCVRLSGPKRCAMLKPIPICAPFRTHAGKGISFPVLRPTSAVPIMLPSISPAGIFN